MLSRRRYRARTDWCWSNALDDAERQIVVLHAVGGMKHRETARLMGMTLTAVLSKYSRAIKKLKANIMQTEGI